MSQNLVPTPSVGMLSGTPWSSEAMPIALMYHDVIEGPDDDASGFPGADAARYKLTRAAFEAHLDAIASAVAVPPTLTFDDGGSSAFSCIAGLLEDRGWRGHFFITTDYIGTPGFVTAEQICSLRDRGHRIGTHSCSHPTRMSSCGRAPLLREWQQSRAILAALLGVPVTSASVPGGYYSRIVAETAVHAGITHLYTSEPTTREHLIEGCIVLGRYTITRGTSPRRAAALARGDVLPRLEQSLSWGTKKLAKKAGGQAYLDLRTSVLNRLHAGRGPRP